MNAPDQSSPKSQCVLVSFCNQPEGLAAFGLLSITGRSLTLINSGVQYGESGLQQATGLVSYDSAAYAVISVKRTAHIVQIAPDFTIVADFALKTVRRPHSIVATATNEFHVVSTGTESVVRVLVSPTGQCVEAEEVIWSAGPHPSSDDLYHLNGLTLANGHLVVSGFGPGWRETLERRKAGEHALYDGFLVDVTTGERLADGLQMPHSPLPLLEGVAVCESAAESVTLPGIGSISGLPGYTRGLCAIDDFFLVGVSQTRQNHPVTHGNTSAIIALDRRDLSIIATIDLTAHTSEIYDLLPVDWPVAGNQSLGTLAT